MDGTPYRPRHTLRETPPTIAVPAQRGAPAAETAAPPDHGGHRLPAPRRDTPAPPVVVPRPRPIPPAPQHPVPGRATVPAPRHATTPAHRAPSGPVPVPVRPWFAPAPVVVEPAGEPDAEGRRPGFPSTLLPRRRRPLAVGAGLAAGIAGMLVVFAVVVGAAGAAGRGIDDAATATAAVGDWRAAGGQVHVTAITGALRDIAHAGSQGGTLALVEACRDLRDEVASARAYPPIPDAVAQVYWRDGLTAGADAARHCIAGASLGDPGLLGDAARELGGMSTQLGAVADRLTLLTGGG
ncbi:hypothetical protein [Pseudonocardia sp. ICBG1293]|uniref:hypothetical protein n=1 Tax=Pseudonocardia sp. ICBG1293 TaxID=2844382 RepID=UPI001CCA68FC|nr:hypothetical protein [Pseudonocardia sp. ICBG1293]